MFFILSDILHSLPIPNMPWYMALWGHGYPLHGLSSVHGVCGVFPIAVLSHCGVLSAYCQVFPPQILYSHCGVKPSVLCVNFSTHVQYHIPLRHGIVGTRKPSPRTFIGQWAGEAYSTLCIVGHGGVCLFVGIVFYLLAYIIIIQDGGGKSNEKNMF